MRRRYYYRGPEGFYHVYNRAVRRLKLFADDGDRNYFIRLLGLTARKNGVVVLAWCLMETHFHLALDASGAAISRMLQSLQRAYARYYNEKTGFNGSLFQGRFCSTWMRDLPSLAYVVRYIHANCRDAGVRPDEYMWSSCRSYMNTAGRPPWFDPAPVLDHLGGVEAFVRYTAEVPPLKKRKRGEDQAQADFVGHVAERVRRRLEGREAALGRHSIKVAMAWVARNAFAVRPRILAMALGFASGACVSALIRRFEKDLADEPELRRLLESC
ncbi:MAG TPA: transposase [Planctomycetota bacterium]|nr:transposase [Planctomycetota bacterium]